MQDGNEVFVNVVVVVVACRMKSGCRGWCCGCGGIQDGNAVVVVVVVVVVACRMKKTLWRWWLWSLWHAE